MPFSDGFGILRYALNAEREDKLFLRWVAMYQAEMGYEEFRQAASGGQQTEDARTAADVLKMVKGIIG